jgi:hypothetical protein
MPKNLGFQTKCIFSHLNIFVKKPWTSNQVFALPFSQSNFNQFNHLDFSLNLKSINFTLLPLWLLSFKTIFKTLKSINTFIRTFYPELRDFDPSGT